MCQWYLQQQYPAQTNFVCLASELKIAHVGNQRMGNVIAHVLQWSGAGSTSGCQQQLA